MADQAAPALRRSKREHQPTAKAAAALETSAASSSPSVPESPAPRRSQRHAKPSVAASALVSTKAASEDTSAPRPPLSASRRDRRSTVASASPAVGASDLPSSPAKVMAKSHGKTTDPVTPATATPNRRRRAATRTAMASDEVERDVPAIMGDSGGSLRSQSRKALGRYTARDCTLVCEAVLDHVRRNALAPAVLEDSQSPGSIRWDQVAATMLKTYKLHVAPRDCQALWKFLAYGQVVDGGDADVMLPASDDEDIERPVKEMDARYYEERAQCQNVRQSDVADPSAAVATADDKDAADEHADTTDPADGTLVDGESQDNPPVFDAVKDTAKDKTASVAVLGEAKTANQATDVPNSLPQTSDAKVQQTDAASGDTSEQPSADGDIQGEATSSSAKVVTPPKSSTKLYPTYDLSTGTPDGWQRPFDLKRSVPLAFVAEKFLRMKTMPPPSATPTVADAAAGTAKPVAVSSTPANAVPPTPSSAAIAPSTTVTTVSTQSPANLPAKPAQEPVSVASVTAGPHQMTTTTVATNQVPTETVKKRKAETKSGAVVKRRQSVKAPANTPRVPFKPSLTPPPEPTPAKSALDFFRMRSLQRQSSDTSASDANLQIESMSNEELEKLFAAATPAFQDECKKLAATDVERFNRECVRRRIWDKAMGSTSSRTNSPLASPSVPSTASASGATAAPATKGDIGE